MNIIIFYIMYERMYSLMLYAQFVHAAYYAYELVSVDRLSVRLPAMFFERYYELVQGTYESYAYCEYELVQLYADLSQVSDQ